MRLNCKKKTFWNLDLGPLGRIFLACWLWASESGTGLCAEMIDVTTIMKWGSLRWVVYMPSLQRYFIDWSFYLKSFGHASPLQTMSKCYGGDFPMIYWSRSVLSEWDRSVREWPRYQKDSPVDEVCKLIISYRSLGKVEVPYFVSDS